MAQSEPSALAARDGELPRLTRGTRRAPFNRKIRWRRLEIVARRAAQKRVIFWIVDSEAACLASGYLLFAFYSMLVVICFTHISGFATVFGAIAALPLPLLGGWLVRNAGKLEVATAEAGGTSITGRYPLSDDRTCPDSDWRGKAVIEIISAAASNGAVRDPSTSSPHKGPRL